MSDSNGQPAARASLAEVKAAAEDLLARASGADIAESELFPYGITLLSVRIRAGEYEVEVEISGPDHAHGDEEEDWLEDDLDHPFNGED